MSDWSQGTAGNGSDGFSAAVEAFRRALEQTLQTGDRQRQIVERYEAYAAVFREALQDEAVVKRATERWAAYAEAVSEAMTSGDGRAVLDTAYDKYVHALHDAWTDLDPDDVDPDDLASIAEEMSWVANVMNAVEQIVKQR